MNTCRRNPQLPPHKHFRREGHLVCEGYQPELSKAPLETKGYIPEQSFCLIDGLRIGFILYLMVNACAYAYWGGQGKLEMSMTSQQLKWMAALYVGIAVVVILV